MGMKPSKFSPKFHVPIF